MAITHSKCARAPRFLFIQATSRENYTIPDEHQQLMRAAHGEKGYYKEIKSKQRAHTPNIHFLLYILLIFVYLFMPA